MIENMKVKKFYKKSSNLDDDKVVAMKEQRLRWV
ncbi:hypothetical protein Sarmat_00806 [Rickettsiales endosymbiont of Paramecium tredecaurelia]|nr:hypothetical protein [Candidatus Sarmatiella mevalonica]